MKKVINFLSTPFSTKKLLGRALGWVVFYRLTLWLLPFARLKRLLDLKAAEPAEKTSVPAARIAEIVSAVRAVSRFVPAASCLTQALAARRLLEAAGQSSQLKFGVIKNSEKFEAHAWVEIGGRIIIGRLPHQRRFSVLDATDKILV